MNHLRRLALFFLFATRVGAVAADPPKPELLVYAAASLTNALDELGKTYTARTGQRVKFSFAASSTLARQIEAGAPADVFIAADTDWADYLQSRKLISSATRKNLLGNQLVLIAPADSTVQIDLSASNLSASLTDALGNGRLAIGDPDSVPAGKYARAALLSLNTWNAVTNKLVLGDSVRTTLNFVGQGAAPLGIVYTTDALIDKHVRIVATFADTTHAAIVYPIALTSSAKADATNFVVFLGSADAAVTFRKYGFTVLP